MTTKKTTTKKTATKKAASKKAPAKKAPAKKAPAAPTDEQLTTLLLDSLREAGFGAHAPRKVSGIVAAIKSAFS